MDRADVRNNLIDAEPPPFTGRILPPLAPRGPEPPSAVAARSHLTGLRHVGLGVPDLRDAVAFYEGVWGLYRVADDRGVVFLGSVGSAEPYIVRLRQAGQKRVDVVSFAAKSAASVDALYTELATAGVRTVREPAVLDTPGGGYGMRFFDIDGRLIEVSSDVAPKPFRDLEIGESVPRRLSHVVLNSTDARRTSAWYQKHLGFRLSDWLADRMAFLRVSPEHHCLSFAQRTKVSLNHISFEMRGLDEYLRGTGRLVRHGHPPLWGPGRHSAGDNTFSYFADPHGNVVEYTTELECILDEDAWQPRIWPATPEWSDQWGTAGPIEDLFALDSVTQEDSGLWTPAPI
ncbi:MULTISPECIES: VOC family protein [Actinomadura]|uniref:Catechol 2,3-dioxygenase n=1 Tax=Actinomadura madurae TaxID=1993 RepID=A0A1I5PRX4_9ACTN|nr:VOC family protein [Actinomadura madurae]SFP36749.1 Catechol 2,3-dioxygenase [Actinomadura madurae]SPT64025.1 Manganese-dependent 2,3-dihydroxybiphenyl 1,2-dioxygenase [Actinomadura madurae]